MILKIVIIGPESTGKSTLCEQLAAHYNTLWCPEYAREYLENNGSNYHYDDLLTIAKGQVALENKYIEKVSSGEKETNPPDSNTGVNSAKTNLPILFIDTNMYVMKVWCEFVFQKCHRYILDQVVERHYDLYLLCNTDLPWVEDPFREYPDLKSRQQLYKMYLDIVINQSTPWVGIQGSKDERLQQAIAAIDERLKK